MRLQRPPQHPPLLRLRRILEKFWWCLETALRLVTD